MSVYNNGCWGVHVDPFLTTCLVVYIISTLRLSNDLSTCRSQWSVQAVFLSTSLGDICSHWDPGTYRLLDFCFHWHHALSWCQTFSWALCPQWLSSCGIEINAVFTFMFTAAFDLLVHFQIGADVVLPLCVPQEAAVSRWRRTADESKTSCLLHIHADNRFYKKFKSMEAVVAQVTELLFFVGQPQTPD